MSDIFKTIHGISCKTAHTLCYDKVDFSGKCIAAISITIIVPLHDRDILEYAEQVVEAAALISSRMGYNAADQQWT